MDEELSYHRQRASRELDIGLASNSLAAARAHLRLSSLHFQKVRELEGQNAPLSDRPLFVL